MTAQPQPGMAGHLVYSTLIYSLPPGELTKPCVSCSVKNITPRIFDTIIKVCSGLEPEQAPPPSPQQLRVAARQGPMRWAHPPPQGAGSWAILITLYRVRYTVVCDGNSQGALRTGSTARHSMQNPCSFRERSAQHPLPAAAQKRRPPVQSLSTGAASILC